jgi:nucleotide-binding universal stress UspA family protein
VLSRWKQNDKRDNSFLAPVARREQGKGCHEVRRREMIPEIKKILYATDFSHNSSYAFLYAMDLALKRDARVVILHAIPPIPPDIMARLEIYDNAGVLNSVRLKGRKEDSELIKGRIQEFCKKREEKIGFPCTELISKIVVSFGHPVDEILKTADEEGCDVIVLGNHGKGFLSHNFLGSVSSGVLHRTRKPVFMIPLPSQADAIDLGEI